MSAGGRREAADTPPPPPRGGGLRLLDLIALVVGYGLAALALRSFWPSGITPSAPVLAVALLGYAWLGLAMSGPFVLLRRPAPAPSGPLDASGRPLRARVGRPLEVRPEPPPRYTRAESAWLLIGGYWIIAAVLVIPTRLPTRGAAILGILPVVVVLGLWVLGPSRDGPDDREPAWTHSAAVLVLASWPVAWLCLILMSATFG